jgi:hypothetical protein
VKRWEMSKEQKNGETTLTLTKEGGEESSEGCETDRINEEPSTTTWVAGPSMILL